MRTTIVSIVLILAISSAALPQETVPQKEDSLQTVEKPKYKFEPIVVNATRFERPVLSVPYAINVIEQQEIQRAEIGISLDEVLRAVPGVVVNNRNNLAQGDRITVRGIGSRAPFGVRSIKIILDGIPLTLPDGQAQLDNLDLGSAGRIEILRGPSSSLYGNSAGGLINIQTQSVQQTSFLFKPQFFVGADGFRKWRSKVSGSVGKHSYLINIDKLKFDGFREHSSANSISVNAVSRHDIFDHLNLTTVFNYFDSPYLLNPSSLSKTDAEESPTKSRFFVQQQGAGEITRQTQGGITLKRSDGGGNQLTATLYGLWRPQLVVLPGSIIELDRFSGGMRAVFSKRIQAGKLKFRWNIGADIETQNDARAEFDNSGIPEDKVDKAKGGTIFDLLRYGSRQLDQDESVFGIGPFTELEYSISPKWMLTFGGRYDHYKFKVIDHHLADGFDDSATRNMNRFSPMIGLVYHPQEHIKIYSNYSTAFQTPTTTELKNRPSGEGGFNPNLKPEVFRSYEFGIAGIWLERKFNYDVSFYILTIDDMLIPFQIQDPEREEIYFRNTGQTKNKGAEITVDWFPVKGLRASFAYTFMDFVFKDFAIETSVSDTVQLVQLAGNEVPGVPPQQFFAGLTYKHTSGAYSEINVRWVDKYFANDFNGPQPGNNSPIEDFVNDAYSVVDVRFGIQHKIKKVSLEVLLGINNLFDERFNGSIVPNAFGNQFFEPAPGRSWYSGVNISFPSTM